MKKVGAITASIGVLLAIGLFFLRRTAWFARQMEKTISEFGELTEAAFWAALLMTVFGLLLLLLGFRRRARREEIKAPVQLAERWVCPCCGTENSGSEVCRGCGTPRGGEPEGWICPYCGTDNPPSQTSCLVCGRPRMAQSWVCPWCGNTVDGGQETCTVCGAVRSGEDAAAAISGARR